MSRKGHTIGFDPTTRILFSGDAIHPGRLFQQCESSATYEASIDRIANYVAENRVSWLLGGHTEMSTGAGQPFAQDARVRHGEHLLELPASIVGKIQTALKAQAGQPRVRPFEEFWLLPHSADPTGKSPPDWCLAWATQRDRRSCRWSCSGPMTGRFPDTPAYPRLAVQQFAAAMAWLVGLLSVVVNRVSVFPLVQVQAVGSLIAMERRLFHTWPQRELRLTDLHGDSIEDTACSSHCASTACVRISLLGAGHSEGRVTRVANPDRRA